MMKMFTRFIYRWGLVLGPRGCVLLIAGVDWVVEGFGVLQYLDGRISDAPHIQYMSATLRGLLWILSGTIAIVAGFQGVSQTAKNITTLGRGGSDTSAAYFGALLGAERVEIWTDVPGMFSANPKEVPDARLLTRLDYYEAQEIATTGAKVLHPRSIKPCRDAGVPMRILDTSRPQLPGTRIDGSAEPVPGVKAISRRNGIVLVSMESIGMWQQVGFLADVFERFKRHGLSIDLIGSSETNVTVSLDPSDNLISTDVLTRLSADLAEVCRVKVIAPCAAITLVGRGMRSLLHRLSDVWATFGRERVHLISQSSNDLNLTFVIDESDGMPSSSAYSSRFVSLLRAYGLVGFTPDRDYRYVEINRELRKLHPEIVREVLDGLAARQATAQVTLADAATPTQALLSVFDANDAFRSGPRGARWCAFLNTAAEFADPPPQVAEVLEARERAEHAQAEAQRLRELKAATPELRVLRHTAQSGQSTAIRTGAKAARAPWIATLDGDGQNDPADIPKLLAEVVSSAPPPLQAPSSRQLAAATVVIRRDPVIDISFIGRHH